MKLKLTILAAVIANASFAQIQLPQVSGAAEVEQTIGYTKIEVDYSRPNLNNRVAFGGELVPYNKIWRTGANLNTTIEISTDIEIENKTLAKGTYAIFTIPTADKWEVVIYKKSDNRGAPKEFVDSLVALRFTVPTVPTKEKIETFTIGFKDSYIDRTTLYMAWENTSINLHIKAKTFEMAENILKTELTPTSSAYDYFSAAYYYYSNKLDMNKALEWVNIAIEKDPQTAFFKDYKAKIEKEIK